MAPTTKKRKLRRIDVVFKNGRWVAERGKERLDSADTKGALVDRVAKTARRSRGTTLRIHKRNGQIQEERSYPRSADPTDSKG